LKNVKGRTKHWTVILLAIGIVSSFGASIVRGQSARQPEAKLLPVSKTQATEVVGAEVGSVSLSTRGTSSYEDRRVSSLICTMSSFFSIDPDEIVDSKAIFDGRGLLSCRNDQGFTTELPVLVDVSAEFVGSQRAQGEIAVSGNSSPFVIPRDVNQLQDAYVVRTPPVATVAATNEASDASLLLRGLRNDLVMELKLNSQASDLKSLKITSLRLRFDETAPDFAP
jgi:hypothetical protein